MNIQWIGSPNFDTTRKPIKQIVIHWFGSDKSTQASTDSWFQNVGGVSAQYSVEEDKIHQYVKEEHTAYSVGVYARNQETISIEFSANINRNASDKTYQTAAELIRDICKRRNIPVDRTGIIKHSEIKATQCPGTIDLDRLIALVKSGTPVVEPLPLPNPGYAPSFEGHDVTQNGIHYKAYKDASGKLLWKIEPQEDYKKKYDDEVIKNTDLSAQIRVLEDRIKTAKVKLEETKASLG